MGLRDWVSEMVHTGRTTSYGFHFASMGLRDWVSEMATVQFFPAACYGCFNGAPRLGLGDGAALCLVGQGFTLASMGLRDWVSEMVTP